MQDPAAIIREIMETAEAPVPLKLLSKRTKLSGPTLTALLAAEIQQGRLFRWPDLRRQQRYWRRSPEAVLRDTILNAAASLAMSPAALAKAVRKQITGYPQKLVSSSITQLQRERALTRYPGFGRETFLLGRTGYTAGYAAAGQLAILAIQEKIAAANHGSLSGDILREMARIEPSTNAPVSVRQLRSALNGTPKADFDRAVLDLRARQKVDLSRHDFPQSLSPADRDLLIDGQDGNYYVAITAR